MGVQEVERGDKYQKLNHLTDGVVAELGLGPSPLNAISLSPDQRHGVVGGRDLMKVGRRLRVHVS